MAAIVPASVATLAPYMVQTPVYRLGSAAAKRAAKRKRYARGGNGTPAPSARQYGIAEGANRVEAGEGGETGRSIRQVEESHQPCRVTKAVRGKHARCQRIQRITVTILLHVHRNMFNRRTWQPYNEQMPPRRFSTVTTRHAKSLSYTPRR